MTKLQGKIDEPTNMVGDLKKQNSLSNWLIKQAKKIIKDIKLSCKINDCLNIIVIERLHSTTGEYTFIAGAYKKTCKNHHTQSQEKKSQKIKKKLLKWDHIARPHASELETNNKNISGKQNQKSYTFEHFLKFLNNSWIK